MLSRHGARFPTAKKSRAYAALVDKIHESVRAYRGSYAFLKDYEYSLGANDLTQFGENQMVDAGIKFYDQYRHLARDVVPFVRASGSERVIRSGELFNRGFHGAKSLDPHARKDQTAPVINLVIPEGAEWNNTLDAGSCPVFEDGPSGAAQTEFLRVFAPSIVEKLTTNLPGVSLTLTEAALFMDLCPFETVAETEEAVPSSLSPFCTLFSEVEWQAYDYYQSLGKYYGHGGGNPLGSTQGVGYVNELIARITRSPVTDHTSVNQTLDSTPSTFPLDAVLYADFTHDNSMTSIFDAFGLYNGTKALSTSQVQSAAGEDADGYSSSWTVPFAARAYFELQKCAAADGPEEEFVRVLVNDRVVPLHGCQVDGLGRCKKEEWIDGLEFARNGGHWGACHNPSSS
jgi:3-phytase